jgi:hypothetical protein
MDHNAFPRVAGRSPTRPGGFVLAAWLDPSVPEAQTSTRRKPAAADGLVARALAILGENSEVRVRRGPERGSAR